MCAYGRQAKHPMEASGEWMLSAQLLQSGNPRMRLSLPDYTCWKSRPGQAYQANPTNHWAPRHCMPPLEARPWSFFTSRSDEGVEGYHESRRICRLADWLPRMPPCPAMKSWGAIRVEVHMLRAESCGNGRVAHRWYLTIHVRNAGMHVKLPDRGCNVRMRVLMRTCMPMLTPTYILYISTHCALSAKDRAAMQASTTTACGECSAMRYNTGQC